MPALPAVGPGDPGDADVLIDVRKLCADSQQQLALGFRVAARELGDSGAAGPDVAIDLWESLSLQLAWIALYLCDPHLNKLKGVNCGPVSQTRVCEPPSKQAGSSTWTAPELTRS